MPKSRFDLRQKVLCAEFRFICQTGAAGVLLQVQPKGNMCEALGCTVYSLTFFPSDPNARLPRRRELDPTVMRNDGVLYVLRIRLIGYKVT